MKLINCPTCGKRISAKLEKCPDCDTVLTEFVSENKKSGGTKKGLLIAIISIVAVAICIAAFIIIYPLITDEKTEEPRKEKADSTTENEEENLKDDKSDNNIDKDDNLDQFSIPEGVYLGDDTDVLVITSDGLAYYYCDTVEYSEFGRAWTYENGVLSIELSRSDCTVKAIIADNDFREIVLKSDSLNWNSELFLKTSADADEYITRTLILPDNNFTMNMDGTMTLTMNDISVTVPDNYVNLSNDTLNTDDNIALVETVNVDSLYTNMILFHSLRINEVKKIEASAMDEFMFEVSETYIPSLIDNPTINNIDNFQIGDKYIYTYSVEGLLNRGFSGFSGYNVDGRLATICDTKTGIITHVMFIQNKFSKEDTSYVFDAIISEIK